ncbi:MAG: hypothetical protein PHN84_14000 [Desulfuromonadaceae bacterium]|nr:hypothetical protein [Desulfuromonadaceae bacterium]MDD2855001.1 hypothetical protein [Desulfuromonadaceae bacterium]
MCNCGSTKAPGVGPFATGRELVEFVLKAHGGAIAVSSVPNGGLPATCQGCSAYFRLNTFVQACPKCGGIHAVSPPRATDPSAIQFAGADFQLP